MIYFDTAYIIKCYIHERGSNQVRELLSREHSAACCVHGRLEFATSILRMIREGRLDPRTLATVYSTLALDDEEGIWSWLPVSSVLLERTIETVRSLPAHVAIRAADALHLECARDNGFREIYSNDRHMLAAADYFGLRAINVVP